MVPALGSLVRSARGAHKWELSGSAALAATVEQSDWEAEAIHILGLKPPLRRTTESLQSLYA